MLSEATIKCSCKGIRKCKICVPHINDADGEAKFPFTNKSLVGILCSRCGKIFNVDGNPWKNKDKGSALDWACDCCTIAGKRPLCCDKDGICHGFTLSCKTINDWVKKTVQSIEGLPVPRESLLLPEGANLDFGATVFHNVITAKEEVTLLDCIDSDTWEISQSGRRKQDYGVLVNFKKKRVKKGQFSGLPPYAGRWLCPKYGDLRGVDAALSRFLDNSIEHTFSVSPPPPTAAPHAFLSDRMRNFIAVELCCLEYEPDLRGASIDPHFDDSWIWGERLFTVNLNSPTLLSFCPPLKNFKTPLLAIALPLAQRSAVVVEGPSRHLWHHFIARNHMPRRRIAVTLREFSQEFVDAANDTEENKLKSAAIEVLEIAAQFTGVPTKK